MSAVLRENTTADSASVRWSPSISPSLPFLPIQFQLLGQIAREWTIVQPLLVTIERGDDSYIASDDVFMMYGLGESIAEAVQDYVSVLTEYYEILSSHNDEPSVSLFSRFQTYLQPIRR
jgi:hypothetical protein